ncbi:MAG: hypothetical protein R2825_02060 [Saprospiraceae bacterium]
MGISISQTNTNSGQDAPDIAGSNDTIGIVWQRPDLVLIQRI